MFLIDAYCSGHCRVLLRPALQELRHSPAAEMATGSTAGWCSSAVSALSELLWLKSTALLEGTPFQWLWASKDYLIWEYNGPASNPSSGYLWSTFPLCSQGLPRGCRAVCLHILLFSPSPQCCSQQHTLINWPRANTLDSTTLMWRANSLEKTLKLGKIEGRWRKGETSDEMVGRHHQLSGHRLEQTPGDSEGQGSLACCSPWGCKEYDTTHPLSNFLGNPTCNTCLQLTEWTKQNNSFLATYL